MRDWLYFNIYRPAKYFYQRRTRGWDDSDLWNLDMTVAKFVLPRLRRFRDYTQGFPGSDNGVTTFEEWQAIIDRMIFSFQFIAEEQFEAHEYSEETEKRVQEGLDLFGKWFRALWD